MQACSNGSSLSYRNGMQLITTQRILRKLFHFSFSRSLGTMNRSNNHIWRVFSPFHQLHTLSWTSTLVNLSSSPCVLCRIRQLLDKSNRAMTPKQHSPELQNHITNCQPSPSATVLPQEELRFLPCGFIILGYLSASGKQVMNSPVTTDSAL